MALDNKKIINKARQHMTPQSQQVIKSNMTNEEMLRVIETYPVIKNEFIDALVNQIGKVLFFNKVFNNPLKELHKGDMKNGSNIEMIFCELAERKGFTEHFSGSASVEGDELKSLPQEVKVLYDETNFKYTFKASISDDQLKGAFYDSYGLNSLLNSLITQLYNSGEIQEYEDMKGILINPTDNSSSPINGNYQGIGIIPTVLADDTLKANMAWYAGGTMEEKIRDIAVQIRTYANKFPFPSTLYNQVGVKTWCPKRDLILFLTPELDAQLDVNLLAFAFNMSKADAESRKIIVDDLGTDADGNKVLCVLADKDLIQFYDRIKSTESTRVARTLTTNTFAHHWGVATYCPFANMRIMVEGSPTPSTVLEIETPVENETETETETQE